jgi:hypothetical protein
MGVMRGFSQATERVLPQIAARILSVPVVTAFVALGAVVIVGRGLMGMWSLLRTDARETQPVVSTPMQHREHRAA